MWGDPFKDLDELGDDGRRERLTSKGLVPGSLVRYGKPGGAPVHAWRFPEMSADSYDIWPGQGVIVAVDCASDPSTDWLFLLLTIQKGPTQMFWVPSGLVTLV